MKKEKKTNRLANCIWIENQKCYLPKCETCPHLRFYMNLMKIVLTTNQKEYVDLKLQNHIKCWDKYAELYKEWLENGNKE